MHGAKLECRTDLLYRLPHAKMRGFIHPLANWEADYQYNCEELGVELSVKCWRDCKTHIQLKGKDSILVKCLCFIHVQRL